MVKKQTKLKMNNSGSTMVEVLIGFVLLMILMASIVGIINLSSDLQMEAKDILDVQEQFQKEIYKKPENWPAERIQKTQVLSGTDYTFILSETDEDGKAKDNKAAIFEMRPGLSLEKVEDITTGLKVYFIK